VDILHMYVCMYVSTILTRCDRVTKPTVLKKPAVTLHRTVHPNVKQMTTKHRKMLTTTVAVPTALTLWHRSFTFKF
jgi:hypothetical protein